MPMADSLSSRGKDVKRLSKNKSLPGWRLAYKNRIGMKKKIMEKK
jgi:hypothetical protein